ncbi:hypothetical protein L0222_08665 [bacterium]|nr:hypothetical protein [bacterium]MCI0605693.1 hypothetical protein [bacterium]
MLIEVRGSEEMLDEIRLFFEDELQKTGYGTGPRLGSMDAGILLSFVKGDAIVSMQVTEESEAGVTTLRIEAEHEIPELHELWDSALIRYGKKVMSTLIDFASEKTRVEQGFK